MGGAERSARKRRQAQNTGRGAPAVTKRTSGDRKPVIIGVVVVLVLLGAVIGGVIYTNNQKNATEGQSIATTELDDAATSAAGDEASYPVQRDGAVVVAGEKAKTTLDVYEDFLCPVCRQFEAAFGPDMERHIADGTLSVRYHMLPMLNDRSDPPGYSQDSANAGLCAADAGKFPEFHKALYNAQPEEGSRGWDKQQLAKLGQDLGIDAPSFKSCVESGRYADVLQSHFAQVRDTAYLQQDFGNGQKGFGTPTVAMGRKVIDTSNPKWLDEVLGDAS